MMTVYSDADVADAGGEGAGGCCLQIIRHLPLLHQPTDADGGSSSLNT